jgi:hypothetical protein
VTDRHDDDEDESELVWLPEAVEPAHPYFGFHEGQLALFVGCSGCGFTNEPTRHSSLSWRASAVAKRFRLLGMWELLEGNRESRAQRGLSASPCSLAGFAQAGNRAVSRESKFANGHWGRPTWGGEQNRG